MPMSSGGRVASSSACATRPKEEEIGLTGSAVPTQRSLLIGHCVMATAEHREPCDSRGSSNNVGTIERYVEQKPQRRARAVDGCRAHSARCQMQQVASDIFPGRSIGRAPGDGVLIEFRSVAATATAIMG